MSTGIVKAGGEVQTLDEQKFMLAVAGISTDEQAREFLREMLDAKSAVMNIRRLAHLRVQFTRLENMAYMELYHKGHKAALREINASLAAACKWVDKLDEDERAKVMSGENGTVLQAYRVARTEIRRAEAMENAMSQSAHYREVLLESFNKTGKVTLTTEAARSYITPYARESKYVPDEFIRDFVDGTKDKVLKAGGYGIGGGVYTRISDKYELAKAIKMRAVSIGRDLKKLAELVNLGRSRGLEKPTLLLKSINQVNKRLDETSLGCLLLLMRFNGCSDASDAVAWTFETESMRRRTAMDMAAIINKAKGADSWVELVWHDRREADR